MNMEKAPEIRVDGVRVAAVDKKRAALYLGCAQLVEQMLSATRHSSNDPWLEIVHNFDGNPKTKTLISATSLEAAYLRIQRGEVPPPIGQPSVMEFTVEGQKYITGSPANVEKYLSANGEASSPE